MSSLRFSKRTAWILAAGCGVLAVIAIGLAVALSRSPSAATPIAGARAARAARVVKLLVSGEGIVSVRLAELGWGDVDSATLQVKRDDTAQPTWIDGSILHFYAPISPTRTMSETVFWLERGALERSNQPGPRISEQPAAPRGDLGLLDHYTAALRLEENHVYAPQVKDGDHWFWAQLPAPITRTIPFTLTALVDGPARLAIDVWAGTKAPTPVDHAYRIVLNDHLLGEFPWDGQGPHTIEADMPAGVLREGANTVTLVLPASKM